AGGPLCAREPRFAQNVARDRSVDDLEHATERFWVGRKHKAQRERQRQHPLSQGLARQYFVGEQRRGLRHPPCSAARAEPALLAAERHELLGATLLAGDPQEAVLE